MHYVVTLWFYLIVASIMNVLYGDILVLFDWCVDYECIVW